MADFVWETPGMLTAILPCNDLDRSEAFYNRLGFHQNEEGVRHDGYRLLHSTHGGGLHLTDAVEGWLVPGRNPFGFYLYTPEVDALAGQVDDLIIRPGGLPRHCEWGMYEFALSDPDETLVRVGWPSRLIRVRERGA